MDVPCLLYDLDVETYESNYFIFFMRSAKSGDNFKLRITINNNIMEVKKLHFAYIEPLFNRIKSQHLKEYIQGIGECVPVAFVYFACISQSENCLIQI